MTKKSGGASLPSSQIPFRPWIYFGLFLAANALLSYVPLSLSSKSFIGVLGIFLPFLLSLWSVLEKRFRTGPDFSPFESREDKDPPKALWFLLGALLLFTRFFRLTSVPFWPIIDEGSFGTLATGIMDRFDGTLLWTEGRIEPFFIWSLGYFFRLVKPSLFALRLYPTLFTVGTAFLAYGAARRYFSRSFSFLFVWLLAFSFWEFSLMRFCTPEDLIPFFEFLALGLLGGYLKSKDPTVRWVWIGGLALVNVGGCYSYVNWMVVWFFISLVLIFDVFGSKGKGKGPFVLFQSISLALLLPLILARFSPGGFSYIQSCWAGSSLIHSLFLYGKGLFWDSAPSYPFSPNWGGMLDPITSSLVLLGVLYSLERFEKIGLVLWGAGWAVSLLPGLLTNYMELHRVTPSLPFWILSATLGAQSLLRLVPQKVRWGTMLILGLSILAVNFYDFIGPYSDSTRSSALRQWRSVQYADAYGALIELNRQTGPLYVFSEFNTDYANKTLNIACYPFDVLQDPRLSKSAVQWAALILNQNYAPFLIREYPGLKYRALKRDKAKPEDPPPFGLFLIPVSQIPKERLAQWIKADALCRQVDRRVHNRNINESWGIYSEMFSPATASAPEDRFLNAVLLEKFAFFKFLANDFPAAAKAYRTAIEKGFAAAHLYYDLGVSLKFSGDKAGSEKALRAANGAIR